MHQLAVKRELVQGHQRRWYVGEPKLCLDPICGADTGCMCWWIKHSRDEVRARSGTPRFWRGRAPKTQSEGLHLLRSREDGRLFRLDGPVSRSISSVHEPSRNVSWGIASPKWGKFLLAGRENRVACIVLRRKIKKGIIHGQTTQTPKFKNGLRSESMCLLNSPNT